MNIFYVLDAIDALNFYVPDANFDLKKNLFYIPYAIFA